MKDQKKKFIITKRVETTPTKADVIELDEALRDKAQSINKRFCGFDFQRRVRMHAFSSTFTDDVVVSISFRKEDRKKHPDKYGDEFRNSMRAFAWEQANEILSNDRKDLRVMIREDDDLMETIDYERK